MKQKSRETTSTLPARARQFWEWFARNEKVIFNINERNGATIASWVRSKLARTYRDLPVEFSLKLTEGKRNFTIGASTLSNFKYVELLHKMSPNLKRWRIVKYRQRKRDICDVEVEGVPVSASDVYYKAWLTSAGKVDVEFFFDFLNVNSRERRPLYNAAFLFLDQCLGEYDVETKVGSVEWRLTTHDNFAGAKPVAEMRAEFDQMQGRR